MGRGVCCSACLGSERTTVDNVRSSASGGCRGASQKWLRCSDHPQCQHGPAQCLVAPRVSSRRVAPTLRRSVQPRFEAQSSFRQWAEGVADDLITPRQKLKPCRAQLRASRRPFTRSNTTAGNRGWNWRLMRGRVAGPRRIRGFVQGCEGEKLEQSQDRLYSPPRSRRGLRACDSERRSIKEASISTRFVRPTISSSGEVRSGRLLDLISLAAFALYEMAVEGWIAFGRQPGTRVTSEASAERGTSSGRDVPTVYLEAGGAFTGHGRGRRQQQREGQPALGDARRQGGLRQLNR